MPQLHNRLSLSVPLSLLTILASPACAPNDSDDELSDAFRSAACDLDAEDGPREIAARAAFSCDFGFDASLPLHLVPPIIERDRMHMADQDGFISKHIPFGQDPFTMQLFGGGRYLFEKTRDARNYAEWVTEGFELGGVQFLDRPEFIAPDCHVWRTISALSFREDESEDVVMRTERWQIPDNANHRAFLAGLVPEISAAAHASNLTAVWLLYAPDEHLVELVYFAGRVAPPPPDQLDFASLGALAAMPTLGDAFDDAGWARVLDRTSIVLTTWYPFELGDQGQPALWPNSPPLPAPYCTDGVCVPSWGEDVTTCPQDCTPNCGDGYCDPDENELACPSDCRLR